MLTCNQINQKIISLADSVRAEIVYEITMDINFSEFYLLALKKQTIEENNLIYNLYKYKF